MSQNLKNLIILVLSIILTSCLNNKDEVEVDPFEKKIELTPETLDGKWEVYYFSKSILDKSTNIHSKYRNTEYDGFLVTFSKDGTYYENNVYGDKTVEGTYKIANHKEDLKVVMHGAGSNPNLEKNAIFMGFKSLKTKKDTLTKALIPAMFEDHFAFRDQSNGIEQGRNYEIDDVRYYRNIEKAPNYMPSQKEFKKNTLTVNDILGRWEFYYYWLKIDGNLILPTPADKVAAYGQQYLFRIVNGRQEFYEFLPNSTVAERSGEFKIIDDVLNLFYIKEKDEQKNVKAYKYWVKQSIYVNKEGYKTIEGYDRYRDKNDVLKDIQVTEFLRKIGDN